MENNEHPTWLVPIDIAKELKEIGFNEPCNHYVRISNDDIKLKINHSSIGLVILKRNSEYLNDDIASFVTIPTWTDVFAWFRARGLHHTIRYLLAHKLYFYAINETYYLKNKGSGIYDTYEEAQKECVKALIKTYKTMKK
ncbi:hypothetical protein [Capnocytophaga leadbetteri]|uniref:hypothetical protein n=1 Tax=Capnocytophaga leadbetteri TaxID=327575 RepID=UPI0028D82904|nr:hypothetical protein [Capnocytophaga leadbetteri]